MTSQIDITKPIFGTPTTQSVRDNFSTAAVEITALQNVTTGGPFLPLAGGHLSGAVYLSGDPTDVMMPATKGYVDSHGSGGGGGIPEAPADSKTYGRNNGAWLPVIDAAGSTAMTGELLLAGNPTHALGATPKQYADAISTVANGAVPLAGGTMTGLLILSGDPANVLGAVTKQYADTALALKAPLASPTFTGTVTTASRLTVAGPSGPALTLYDTTAARPCFGVYNTNSLLNFGLTTPATGNPNGAAYATMDANGNFAFNQRVNVAGGRLIVTNTNNPSLTLNNPQSNYPIFGFWNSNVLNIGITDANGVPQTVLGHWDSSGNLYAANFVTGHAFAGTNWQLNSDGSGNIHLDNGSSGAVVSINLTANTVACGLELTTGGSIHVSGSGIFYPGVSGVSAIGWQWNAGAAALSPYVNGNWVGNITPVPSDRRLKTGITDSAIDAVEIIRQIPMHAFDLTLPHSAVQQHWDLGIIADEIADLIPHAVIPAAQDDHYDTINLFPLLVYALRAIQQLADGKKRR